MFPAPFTYIRPRGLPEALQFLADHGEDTKVLAGGQSLIPLLKLRLVFPRFVMDIARLPELRQVDVSDSSVEIGALVRHVEIERSPLLAQSVPLLPETAAAIGDVQVRNRGTIGGSLVHADAAADFPAAALALEAQMVIRNKSGERTVKAADFFVDLMTTAVQADELLTSIRFPATFGGVRSRAGFAYLKLAQQASGFAIAGAAAAISLDERGNIAQARVGITGVSGIPYRAVEVEKRLAGMSASEEAVASTAPYAAEEIEPLSDIHGSADYRREMACVMARRAMRKALQRAKTLMSEG